MRLRSWLVVAVAALATLLLVGRAVTTLIVDHAWYAAMGVPNVFWERLTDSVLLQGVAFVLGSTFAFVNLHAVRRTILAVAVPSRVANIELTAMLPSRRLLSITLLAAVVVGFALSVPLTNWTTVAMARHGVPFGEIEGILDRDLGFYVYRLPLEETAYIWTLAAVVIVMTIVLLLYALTRSLRLDGRRIVASNHVRRHLSVLGALIILLLAWSYRLDSFDLLQRGSGPDGMFLRLDHVISLQADRILVVVCAVAAPILLRAGWIGQLRAAFITLTLVLTAALGGRQVLPIVLTRSALTGDPARRDLPYVATRTLVSRRAYDVDAILTATPESATPAHTAVRTKLSLSEVGTRFSVWEPDAARARTSEGRSTILETSAAGWSPDAAGHVSAIVVKRPAAGMDRWSVSLTDATQPMLRDSVTDIAIGARGNNVDSDGEPIVAPGMQGHALVAEPAGVLGTPLRALGMRVAHAWAARDASLLDADTVDGPAARLVAHRDVRDRLARLAPIFAQGQDIQPIIHDGALLWALNLYSTSARFPLSQHWMLIGEERSYFRLAATALIDAATGRVRLVSVERPDPVAQTWFARIPSLVVRTSDLPATLVDRLPPPTDGSIAQIRTFAKYGSRMEGNVARHLPDSVTFHDAPVHLVGSDVGTASAWSVPLLDGADLLDGVATSVGGRFRRTYWDSTTVPRARWGVLVERLRASLDTARANVPEGSRREPRMRIGHVSAVPSANGAILVQSLFWNRVDGAPIISRVAVLDGAQLALGGSIAEATASLRGLPTAVRPANDWLPVVGAAREERITRLYDVMRDAMKRGEWTRFGAAFDSLGLVMGRPPR